MRHLLCLLTGGHRPGGAVLFSYGRTPQVFAQRPDLRGATAIRVLGVECSRCRKVMPPSLDTVRETVAELVENLVENIAKSGS